MDKKKILIIAMLMLAIICLGMSLWYFVGSARDRVDSNGSATGKGVKESSETSQTSTKDEETIKDINGESHTIKEKDGITYIDDKIILVNKKHGLPTDYSPGENPEAGSKVRELISEMQSEGFDVNSGYSGFRSFEYQKQLYNGYVESDGKEKADTYSARPGYSEHQTGLAFDLLDNSGQLLTSPNETKWLAEHAADYGFIVRYQEGKEDITGYVPESWHLRYLGRDLAKKVYKSGKTLEEYFQVEGGKSYN